MPEVKIQTSSTMARNEFDDGSDIVDNCVVSIAANGAENALVMQSAGARYFAMFFSTHELSHF